MTRTPYSTGDLVLFAGRGLVSAGIKLRTCWPWESPKFSHVGLLAFVEAGAFRMARGVVIAGRTPQVNDDRAAYVEEWLGDGRWLIFESTTMAPRACAITGQKFSGVQAHEVATRVASYGGQVYHLPWRGRYRLDTRELPLLPVNLLGRIGTPYDAAKAALVGSCFLKYVWPYEAADRSSVFCAAFVARQIGQLTPGSRLPHSSPNRWSPARLARTLIRNERCGPLQLIPKTEEIER